MSRISSPIVVATLMLAALTSVAAVVNWSGRAEAAPAAALTTVHVSLPVMTASQGSVITVPITTGDITGLGVVSYDSQVTYDPAVLLPSDVGFDVTGTISAGLTRVHTNLNFPGHLVISAFGNGAMAGVGTLLNLKFTVVGTSGHSTSLVFEDWQQPGAGNHPGFTYNEGVPATFTTNGTVSVNGNTPTASPTATATSTATPTASPAVIVPVPVALPDVNAAPGAVISIPVNVGETTGLAITLYELQVTFDPAVLQPASPAYVQTGTLSGTSFVFTNVIYPGHLIVLAQPNSGFLAGSGVLVYLRFTVVGALGQSTGLTFEDFTTPNNGFHPGFGFNEGDPANVTTNGSVIVADTAISGTVTYANSGSNLTPNPVSDALIRGEGSVAGLAMTGIDGVYLYSGFGLGSYTITPFKTGAVNGSISSYDAAKVAQHVAGIIILGTFQKYVANVSGDTSISSFDAAMIAKFVAGPPYASPGIGSTATWRFLPSSRTYASTVGTIANENYDALLMGEVSGNWTNTGSRPVSSKQKSIAVGLPKLTSRSNKEIVVPVRVRGVANTDVIAYEFDLRYDPLVMQPQTDPVDLARTVSRGLTAVANGGEPGLLRVVVYGPMPITEDGVLLNLRFISVGKPGSASPLSFERIMFNEGEPRVTSSDGHVELF
jgi:hypothetical protein